MTQYDRWKWMEEALTYPISQPSLFPQVMLLPYSDAESNHDYEDRKALSVYKNHYGTLCRKLAGYVSTYNISNDMGVPINDIITHLIGFGTSTYLYSLSEDAYTWTYVNVGGILQVNESRLEYMIDEDRKAIVYQNDTVVRVEQFTKTDNDEWVQSGEVYNTTPQVFGFVHLSYPSVYPTIFNLDFQLYNMESRLAYYLAKNTYSLLKINGTKASFTGGDASSTYNTTNPGGTLVVGPNKVLFTGGNEVDGEYISPEAPDAELMSQYVQKLEQSIADMSGFGLLTEVSAAASGASIVARYEEIIAQCEQVKNTLSASSVLKTVFNFAIDGKPSIAATTMDRVYAANTILTSKLSEDAEALALAKSIIMEIGGVR